MFKVGQKVVCVEPYSSNRWELKRNKIYIVQRVENCKCQQNIHVGICDYYAGTSCYCCGHDFGEHYCYHRSSRFRLVDETFATEVLEQIKEQIEEELTNI